jgi:hypothetical protein
MGGRVYERRVYERRVYERESAGEGERMRGPPYE